MEKISGRACLSVYSELTAKQPEMLDSVVAKQVAGLEVEIASLTKDAERLAKEIGELTAARAPG